ncbi:MAG: BatB protein, partial [Bacteroidota bacterium]
MIQFDEKMYFSLLAIIPVMAVAFFFLQIWKRRTQKQFADPRLLRKLAPDKSQFKSTLKLLFLLTGLGFLIL